MGIKDKRDPSRAKDREGRLRPGVHGTTHPNSGSTSRGELRACRRRMELLVKQQESVAAEMAAERAANNM